MRQILRVCALLLPLCAISIALAKIGDKLGEESMSGRSFRAAQAASREFASNGLDISHYRIVVTERKDAWWVFFIDADVTDEMRLRARGSPGKIPGFEVEVSRDDFKAIRSSFIR
jgi:hypothetical protein